MVCSMTGFGMAIENEGQATIRAELKSVNHRYLELTLNIPRPLNSLETQIRALIQKRVRRGALTLFLTIDDAETLAPRVTTNWPVIDQYLASMKQIQSRVGTEGGWDYSRVLSLPGVFTLQEADENAARTLEPSILRTIDHACQQMTEMRQSEGERLTADLQEKIDQVKACVQKLTEFTPEVRKKYEEKLRRHMTDFLGDSAAIDEERLMNELAVFADRSAIDEELIRLQSHIGQFLDFIDPESQVGAVGRRLDFLIQEMNREVNTIGSKGNSARISRYVIQLKNEIEKIREQVQNVE
ncbi:MAG: YicC/YloC family endoribonuclease [Sporolactobacillus sp.]